MKIQIDDLFSLPRSRTASITTIRQHHDQSECQVPLRNQTSVSSGLWWRDGCLIKPTRVIVSAKKKEKRRINQSRLAKESWNAEASA